MFLFRVDPSYQLPADPKARERTEIRGRGLARDGLRYIGGLAVRVPVHRLERSHLPPQDGEYLAVAGDGTDRCGYHVEGETARYLTGEEAAAADLQFPASKLSKSASEK